MSEEDKPVSIMFEHCVRIYDEMKSQAREEPNEGLVYEGHLTKLFAGLQMPTPYYTTIKQRLVRMGCIEQIRRGGGNSPSRWRLLREPAEDTFQGFEALRVRSTGKVATLEQQFKNLREEYYQLRNDVDILKAAILQDREVTNV